MVVAPTTVEAVRCAGGWLFDRVMAGWDVTVLTADHSDSRPLRILGARAADLEGALASPVRGPGPQAIAVDGQLYESDARVRRMVLAAVEGGAAEVRLWGEGSPTDLNGGAGSVLHRLSVAARAFKAQALAAAAAPVASGGVTEMFRSSTCPVPTGPPDLIPAA